MLSRTVIQTLGPSRRRVVAISTFLPGRRTSSNTATSSHSSERNDGKLGIMEESPPFPRPPPPPSSSSSPREPTLWERTDKSFFQRLYDKYSFQQQTNRIVVAESFLQAATRQASDPYVFDFLSNDL